MKGECSKYNLKIKSLKVDVLLSDCFLKAILLTLKFEYFTKVKTR